MKFLILTKLLIIQGYDPTRLDLGLGRLFAGLASRLLVLGDEIGLELLAVPGQDSFRGMELALNEFKNSAGQWEVAGKKIKYVTRDSETKAGTSARRSR